jgi:gamma-glutamylcyclotransferase (GGCT)/AIG2-like uncharacterized protein YtfP
MANGVDKNRKAETKKTLLFVYGTLMRGGKLHRALASSPNVKFVGKAKIRAELYRPRGEEYPGAVRTAKPNRFVYGELYALRNPDRILKRIDEIEGCDEGLFLRRIVDVWQHGKKHRSWTYLYAKSVSSAEPLPHGKFLPVHAVA